MSIFSRNQQNLDEDVAIREVTSGPSAYDGRQRIDNAANLDLDRIVADEQHREEFDETSLRQLADSMKQHGQLQPIRVRWAEERGLYVIIAGERRWRAAHLAGMSSVACVIVEGTLSHDQILAEQIIENALREDLKTTEKAKAFNDLMNAKGWNGKQLAGHLNLAPSNVSRTLAVLTLSDELKEKVDAGTLSIRDALKIHKATEEGDSVALPSSKRKPKPSRERKIAVNGFTVTVKARRILDADRLREALNAALAKVNEEDEQEPLTAAA